MIGRIIEVALGWIPRSLRAALSLSGEQRQTLMSWGLLGGVIALTALKLWSLKVVERHWRSGISETVETRLIDGLFAQLGWDTLLQAALAFGVVAIARGGSMAVSVTRGGLTIDFQASGQAAKTLAQDTTLSEAMAPQAAAPQIGDNGQEKANG